MFEFIKNALRKPHESAPQFADLEDFHGEGSVMVLDILGLDFLHERFNRRLLFETMLTLDRQIKEVIARTDGMHAGNLRSGLECFFGWGRRDRAAANSQAAFDCAVHLQRINSKLILDAAKKDHPILSIKIGIHSSDFSVCRLATEKSQHTGLLGAGYLVAKSLNHACNINSILLSEDTVRHLAENGITVGSEFQRKIRVPGRAEQILAYDFDPLREEAETKAMALQALQMVDRRKKENERFNCELDPNVVVQTNRGTLALINFSRGGLCLRGKISAKPGDIISVSLEFRNEAINKRFRTLTTPILSCEIRWKRETPQFTILGAAYLGASEHQKEQLLNFLCENLQIIAEENQT